MWLCVSLVSHTHIRSTTPSSTLLTKASRRDRCAQPWPRMFVVITISLPLPRCAFSSVHNDLDSVEVHRCSASPPRLRGPSVRLFSRPKACQRACL